MPNRQFIFSGLVTAMLISTYAHGFQTKPSQTDFGGVGLMQMPSARHAEDGQFSLGTSLNSDYYHYFASLQLMPWLETTIRYTQAPGKLYNTNPNFSGDTIYTDKGIDMKLRLLEESFWLPELSVGLRDLGGTGLFDGEYIAASKRYKNIDFTMGIGWGYIGNSANLFGDKSEEQADCDRNTDYKGKGGGFDYSRWFSGCASFFTGIEYQTSFSPLSLKLEYDSNDYLSEFIEGPVQDLPFNFGVVYRFGEWGDLKLSYERGNTWSFGFTFNTNFNQYQQTWLDSPKPAYSNAAIPMSIDWEKVSDDLQNDAGYAKNKIYLSDDKVTVVGRQQKYRQRQLAQDRAAMILLNSGVKATQFSLIEESKNQLITQTNIDAKAYKKVANHEYVGANVDDALTRVLPKSPRGRLQVDTSKPWSVSVAPTLQQSFGGSEGFYMFNLGLSAGANYWFNDNVEISGGVYVNLYDNYHKFLYDVPPDGTDLKRVRTLIRQYITDNPVRVSNLQLTVFEQFKDDFYTQTYAGYLETMFAGVGGEILYRPLNSHWALGFDINYVAQRDPDAVFGIFTKERHLDTLTNRYYNVQTGTVTGHATLYYRPEWKWFNDLTFKVSAGQYLAEDKGVTLDGSKQFDSGVIVGAYLTKTNLSAEEFGEGSFNKGFYISIPFDVFTIKPSVNRSSIVWTPLSRDGGQMLNKKYSLFNMTSARDVRSELTQTQ